MWLPSVILLLLFCPLGTTLVRLRRLLQAIVGSYDGSTRLTERPSLRMSSRRGRIRNNCAGRGKELVHTHWSLGHHRREPITAHPHNHNLMCLSNLRRHVAGFMPQRSFLTRCAWPEHARHRPSSFRQSDQGRTLILVRSNHSVPPAYATLKFNSISNHLGLIL